MRLSVNSEVLSDRFGDERTIEMLKRAGFDCIDYTFLKSASKEMYGENYKGYIQKFRMLLEKNNMTCNQAHAPYELRYGDAFDVSDEKYARLVRAIEAAAMLGAENIVVHSITTPDDVDVFAYNLTFFKSLEPYCERFGIHVAIENLYDYKGNTFFHAARLHSPELLNMMIEKLQSPWFVVCIDVGHASLTGYEPDVLIRGFDNRTLKALHIHDNDYRFDWHTLPYMGKFDWDKIMRALRNINYQGDFTYEIGSYARKFQDDFVEEALCFAAKTGRYLMKKFTEV